MKGVHGHIEDGAEIILLGLFVRLRPADAVSWPGLFFCDGLAAGRSRVGPRRISHAGLATGPIGEGIMSRNLYGLCTCALVWSCSGRVAESLDPAPRVGTQSDDISPLPHHVQGSPAEASVAETAPISGAETPMEPADSTVRCPVNAAGALRAIEEAAFIGQGSIVTGRRPECGIVRHPIAGARESVMEITLDEWDGHGRAHLSVSNLRGEVSAAVENAEHGDSLTVRLRRSGELLVHLSPSNPEESANDYSLGVRCLAGCEAEYTRYPVVLFHGLGRADGLEDRQNFYGVEAEMAHLGYAVYGPTVSPFDGWASRALEWESHLDALVEAGAGRRFNVIAHSLGGLDARYLISVLERADLVASLITIGTPHHGTLLADLATGVVEGHPASAIWVDLSASVFALFFGGADDELSLVEAMSSLTTNALAELNELAPDDDAVYYASWTGETCSRFDEACQAECPGETVHPLLAAGFTILRLDGTPNDGMVPASSTIWGDHRGTVCADHADQVGLFADGETGTYDHLAFYRSELRRLADRGL